MAFCNRTPGQPYVFVDGWLLKANVCETGSLRQELGNQPLPPTNALLLADSGFDDKSLFELCESQNSTLVTPITTTDSNSDERYLEYVNCGFYKQCSLLIEPLWAYLKSLFNLQETHQYGLCKKESEVLAAMAIYNLIVYYNFQEGLKYRAVKPFLDVL